MAPVVNPRVLFNEIPEGYPQVGKTVVVDESEQIDLESVPLNGGILIRNLVLSVDPYQRGKMKKPTAQHYSGVYLIGKPIDGYGVALVLRSENPKFTSGDHVFMTVPFSKYAVITEIPPNATVLERVDSLPWSTYIGVAGMPGMTGYMGWKAYAKAKKGETLFVTTGAGAVGSMVIQLAKLDGLKVIASAGSDEKVAFMKEIGADVAFNYKTQSTKEILDKHGPIDIYWDHVGGEVLDLALGAANTFARFIEVGMISTYNTGAYPITNIGNILYKSITMQGFIVSNLRPTYLNAFYKEVPPLVAAGKIKHKEDIRRGLESVGQAIVDVLTSGNTGKTVVVLDDE